ncbi:MAG: hypothetical protein ACR2L3_05290 [Actinomycetota bacterium]
MTRRLTIVAITAALLTGFAAPAQAEEPQEVLWCLLHWSEC